MSESITEYRTPHTRLWWSSLGEWLDAAYDLDRRRPSALTHKQRDAHREVLPVGLIWDCDRRDHLAEAVGYLESRKPPRGWRAHAPTTPRIVAAKNQIARIDRVDDLATIPDGHNAEAIHG